MKSLKVIQPHIIAAGIFLIVTMAYFFPLLEGKDVSQSDMTHAAGMAQELNQYHKQTGQYAQWTNSMFSGMPAYHVGAFTPNYNIFTYLLNIISLKISPASAGIIFVMMLCFYFLLLVMGVNPWISIAGAIAFAFSSYNFVIIGAGHVTKAWGIAFIPLIIAGVILLYRNRYLFGSLVLLFGLGMNISRNHMQVTYYSAFIVGILVLGFFIEALQKKEIRNFLYASLIMSGIVILALLPNAVMMYTNYEISKTSIRGRSELTQKEESKKGGGLDKDYAFSWSYGVAESFSVLIPNFMGGISGTDFTKEKESALYIQLNNSGADKSEVQQFLSRTPTYWGDMPFTSGPAYHGAIICFLFVLGLFIIKNRLKWWLLAITILSFFLAWGRNFSSFNDLMFYYFPMYSKFRTVSMALVIAQFTMPFLAILAVWEFLSNLENKKHLMNGLKWSAIITGGLCLFFALFGRTIFDFTSAMDEQMKTAWYYSALLADRESMLRSDAFRSLAYILLAGLVLWFILMNNKYVKYAAPLLALFILADMWTVGKRYLNNDSFVKKSRKYDFPESAADKFILQDKDPSYRVLNLNNPFNEVYTSYFHKSIGGYHGAKQRRYQELIENQIQPEISSFITVLQKNPTPLKIDSALRTCGVLNMLNSRYIIYNPGAAPLRNSYALGNAWFVKDYKIVENADQEIQEAGMIDPSKTAVIDKRFAGMVKDFKFVSDSSAAIKLLSYKPGELQYEYSAAARQLAVFSEVYYPSGWEATVDGKPVEHFRADWILRAMVLPEGKHNLEFKFAPKPLYAAEKVSLAGSILVGLLLAGGLAFAFKKNKEQDSSN